MKESDKEELEFTIKTAKKVFGTLLIIVIVLAIAIFLTK